MYDRIRIHLRRLVRSGLVSFSAHAFSEMQKDGLFPTEVLDVLTHGVIFERQRDKDTGEWKYLFIGDAQDGSKVVAVVKESPNNKIFVITVFKL